MKTRLALFAATSWHAAGVVAFVLPGSRLPKSCSTTTSPAIISTTTSTTRLAPIHVKADWFDRIPNAPEGADEGSMDDGMTSVQYHNRRKKDNELAVAGDELRAAVRDAIWELDDRIHEMLPYDEKDADADPMYFLNALEHTLEGFGSHSKAMTDENGRVVQPGGSSSGSSSSSRRNDENNITAMINKEIAMISSSTKDIFSKAQSSAEAMQASLTEALGEGVKLANAASDSLSTATDDTRQQNQENVASAFTPGSTMASSSVVERPAAAAAPAAPAAAKEKSAPVVASPSPAVPDVVAASPSVPVVEPASESVTTGFCEEETPRRRPQVTKGRSQRWVDERNPRSSSAATATTRRPQQQLKRVEAAPPMVPAPVKLTPLTTGTASKATTPSWATKMGGAPGGIPPRKRRDQEREEEQRRRKKAEAALAQAQQRLQLHKQKMPPPSSSPVSAAASVDKAVIAASPAPPAAAASVDKEVNGPALKVKIPSMPAEEAAKVIEELSSPSAPKTIKRMTTGADRARGVIVVDDDVLSVSSPTSATTVQQAMKQAKAKSRITTTKAVITTAADLLVPPPSAPSTTEPTSAAASTTISSPPSLLGAADANLNPMPPVDRTSVENILRDSRMAAVEEWHRTRSVEKEMSLEDKVLLVETRLVDEILAGPSEAIMNYINVLEKIGEHQATPDTTVGAAVAAGNWDLAYSSAPVAPFFSLPRMLARFLVGVSAKVESGGKNVVYRSIFKFFDWFPRLRRTQKAVVSMSADSPRKTVEVMSGRPRFTLGKLFSFVAPKLPSFGKKKAAPATLPGEEPRLMNTCTYLGAHLKICRLMRTPGVSADPLLAVFLRGKAEGNGRVGGEMTEDEGEELLVTGRGGVGGAKSGSGKIFGRWAKASKGGNPSTA
ncbi:hypothetical protein VYU27_003584 [Nannochloropsis oceanica]